jgi:triosephosphate isomerase
MKKNKKPLLVGNWKMNHATFADTRKKFLEIKKAASQYKDLDVVICPPYPYIPTLVELSFGKSFLSGARVSGTLSLSASQKPKKAGLVSIGAQDVSIYEEGGSRTGEVGAKMLTTSGADYIIVGHSERRALGDTGQTIALKIQQVLKTHAQVIVCVGEKERDADAGYLEVIKAQLKEALVHVARSDFHKVIIAYEPVWAIGNKNNIAITSYDLHQMVVYIKKFIRETWGDTISSMTKVLYGGSVTGDNAEDILINGQVDGLLIGRSSWEASSFKDIFYAIDKAEKTHNTKELKKTLKKVKDSKSKRTRK